MTDMTKPSTPPKKFKSLGVRAISAIVLMLICGMPIYYGGWGTVGLVAVFGVGMIWEWVRMTDPKFSKLAVVFPVVGALIAFYFAGLGQWQNALCVLGATAVLAMFERFFIGKDRKQGALWASMGVLYILLPCLAFIWLRGDVVGVKAAGFAKLLFVVLVVIAADSFAYLGGSTFKGPKLAPKISPNKTWSGFLSGLICGGIVGIVVAYFTGLSPVYGLAFAVPIVLASVFGDLLESAIKRHLNVKDAGDLLPGHGGLLDRVDALMCAVLVAVIALLLWPVFFSGVWPL